MSYNIIQRIAQLPLTGKKNLLNFFYLVSTLGSSFMLTQGTEVYLRRRLQASQTELEQPAASAKPLRYLIHHAVKVIPDSPIKDILPPPLFLAYKVTKLAVQIIPRPTGRIAQHPLIMYTWAKPERVIKDNQTLKSAYAEGNKRFSEEDCYLSLHVDESIVDKMSLVLVSLRYIVIYIFFEKIVRRFVIDPYMDKYINSLKSANPVKRITRKKTIKKTSLPYDPTNK